MKHTLFTLALVLLASAVSIMRKQESSISESPAHGLRRPVPTESFRRQILYVRNGRSIRTVLKYTPPMTW